MDRKMKRENFKEEMARITRVRFKKELDEASNQELYYAVALAAKDEIVQAWMQTHKKYSGYEMKKLFYFSMEFLPGRILSNNLMNLGSYEIIEGALKELHIDINEIENQEKDIAIGNGGLGRLGACFLESLSTLGYPAYGCGIKYDYGLFKQDIVNGGQVELPDDWQGDDYPLEIKREEYIQYVRFGNRVVKAVPYDIPIVGGREKVVNSLRLWHACPVDSFDYNRFNRDGQWETVNDKKFCEDITKVLYPNDERYEGKELRLKQQYFFVSASLQLIVKQFKKQYHSFKRFPEKICLHMNDTHPTLIVPELMRILMDEEGLSWNEAWKITTKTCAFTNHTIMAEAMEKWPIDLFENLLPRIYKIVHEINRRFVAEVKKKYPNDEEKIKQMAILYDGQIRMANMAIIASFSVNGVAKLHTEILKKRELKAFYEYMPEKFNNKTNGVSQRRFLNYANPELRLWRATKWWDNVQGEQEAFVRIKQKNKERLAKYIQETTGIQVDVNSIFDVQVKRIHEYKRQLMNVMRIMHFYNKLRANPDADFYPMTFIFAGKAAASYRQAKRIIKLIHAVADKINNDESINGKLKVVFLKNYNVSQAEIIIPGTDVSEQISTASKEASGTGNMKFMMNGAVTIGTLDGANVEILEAVGEENMFIFGMTAEEVMEHERIKDYDPKNIYLMNPNIRQVVDQLADGTYKCNPETNEEPRTFADIKNDLLYGSYDRCADTFFVLKDLDDYIETTMDVNRAYRDREHWAAMAIANTKSADIFSSDRTIQEYVKDIWKLEDVFTIE